MYVIQLANKPFLSLSCCRIQKLRASRSKDEVDEMRCQLAERDAVISDLETEIDSIRTQRTQLSRDKQQTDEELSALHT